ncbi:MAG TPA: tRNA (guanine(46)-N(7))-methyltransferase TrmB [Rhabdochlamydiaceae bacterium]|nr:tRNA (guanine(46)-N(7))-methyltransferase TrmB [Rhabdochlamydiaceae bacterium]
MKPTDLKFPYKWETRRPLIENGVFFVPDYYANHHEFVFPEWSEIFGNHLPVVIEYCTGNGTWIAEKAKDRSQNWVAIEWDFERVRKIWSKMKNYGLTNLFIVCGEALTFTREYLKDSSTDLVYINFPDPWPKEKHAKNRIFQRPFVEQLARTVKSSSTVTIATDDATYGNQISQEMRAIPQWISQFSDPYFVTEWQDYGASYFDSLWRSKGKEIRYFQFRRLDEALC